MQACLLPYVGTHPVLSLRSFFELMKNIHTSFFELFALLFGISLKIVILIFCLIISIASQNVVDGRVQAPMLHWGL